MAGMPKAIVARWQSVEAGHPRCKFNDGIGFPPQGMPVELLDMEIFGNGLVMTAFNSVGRYVCANTQCRVVGNPAPYATCIACGAATQEQTPTPSPPSARQGDTACFYPDCPMQGQPVAGNTCSACGRPTQALDRSAPGQPALATALAAPGTSGTMMPGPATEIGSRFVARLIDAGILFVPAFCIGGLSSATESGSGEPSLGFSILAIIWYLGIFLYEFVMLRFGGQTVGKRVMKLKVVRLTGESIGWGPAAIRVYVPALASCFTCGIMGLLFGLSPLFDSGPWKRGWSDQLASTVVIRVA
jgi:uncharacterized RDD family membrane protein YckC